MDRLLLRVTEAAEIAAVSKSQAYKYVRSGEWPTVMVGSKRRVIYAGLLKWIERQGKSLDMPMLYADQDEEGRRVIRRG